MNKFYSKFSSSLHGDIIVPGDKSISQRSLILASIAIGMSKIKGISNSVAGNANVIIVDDLIATGGTALAATSLTQKCEANILELCFLIDLPELLGSKRLNQKGFKTYSLIEFEGN